MRINISIAAVLLAMSIGGAQAQEQIEYRLSFPDAQNHYLNVEATFPTAGKAAIELFMPVWTPGSYMLREYSRNLEGFQAHGHNGQALAFEKTRKNRWRITTSGAPQVKVHYRLYGREMTVRNNWVEADFALLTPASVYMGEVGNFQRPYRVTVQLPEKWRHCLTGLAGAGAPNTFVAKNFDELIDSPIVCGNPAVYKFPVKGVEHVLVNQGEGSVWDGQKSARDVARIVETAHALWGDFPYAKYAPGNYHFFNMLVQAPGGLEHHNSTVLMASRWAQRVHKDYLDWLSLVAHEHFHAWNVKTLRPVALRPFDYENENYTPSLWIAEGITAYYDNLLVRRSGLSTRKEYLDLVSKDVERLQTSPGREVQSLAAASYDAWIKFYRPDENFANTAISYYVKGSIVAMLLDARIRHATHGQRSLDDLMRAAYQRYSGERGYTEAEFRKLAEEIAGQPLGDFFSKYVDGTAELDYAPALKYYGLRFKKDEKKDQEPGWLGAKTAIKDGRLVVTEVRRNTPGYSVGLNVDDEILAVDDYRVAPEKDKLEERLKAYVPGTQVNLLVARREVLRRIPVKLARKPSETWALEMLPDANAEQQQHLLQWLGPEKQ